MAEPSFAGDSASLEPRRGVVGIVARQGKLLVIRRSRHVVAPGAYCFPGGGIELGESEQEALVREFQEELCSGVRPIRLVWRSRTAWGIELAWWLAEFLPGAEPVCQPAEVESIGWYTPDEMARLPGLLDSNRLFLEALATGQIAIEDDRETETE